MWVVVRGGGGGAAVRRAALSRAQVHESIPSSCPRVTNISFISFLQTMAVLFVDYIGCPIKMFRVPIVI